MEAPLHRRWIDNWCMPRRGEITPEFYAGVDEFIQLASSQESFIRLGVLKCPCIKCECLKFKLVNEVKRDLCKHGFMKGYYYWTNHGEEMPIMPQNVIVNEYYRQDNFRDQFNPYEQMVMDAAGPSHAPATMQGAFSESGYQSYNIEEPPNENVKAFYEMLSAAQSPLYSGCDAESELSAAVRMLSIKSYYNMPEGCYNEIMQFMQHTMSTGNRVPDDFYHTKKLVSKLGLGCQKIDCCPNSCMLYYKDDQFERSYKFCSHPRFKSARSSTGKFKEIPFKRMWYLPLIPRLQRIYASTITVSNMRWHYENRREFGVLSHPSDGEAWKYFDRTHPDFSADPRNVRLGLCVDGFTPYGQSGRPYSCWPVIVTLYNLPPGLCLKREFMFLTVIIPGPSNPKSKIDVFLQPLIDELKLLWHEGVLTYDISTKQNFMMKAALL
ncbi:uncharacterized protein LOC127802254 [Diospyros lotus]|uniref:uncharacterized protein LOC127802254 n=1 Tax=Diospyros lotus TaxID=55363 RepID=UPI00224E0E6C|nr:uncharacterized protein LOC127802254 [Diospyros lotus]